MPRNHIAIVGAGVGGLTLARCLQYHKIPFTIYERAPESARHNYGIWLAQQNYQALLEVLQMKDYEFQHALAVVKAYGRRAPLANRSPKKGIPTPLDISNSRPKFRANRSAFEALLSKPIQNHIRYSSKVTSIRGASSSGSEVELTLDNNAVVESDLVIDCSGVHSPIRAALLPQYQLVTHPYVAINGKRRLRSGTWEDVYEAEFGDQTVLQTSVQFNHEFKENIRSITARLEVAINETVLDRADGLERVSISFTYSRQAFPEDDALYMPNRSKEAATDIPPQFFEEMMSLRKSGKLSEVFMEAFNPSVAVHDRLLSWLLRSVHLEDADIKALRDQGILMIGDAAYAEPIIGSVPGGANHVIRQAIRLADRLALELRNGKEVSETSLDAYLEPKPRSRKEDVAVHLERIHQLEPTKAVL